MKQTPMHEIHNPDLLAFMGPSYRRVVEVGCSSGALAREYRKINPAVEYVGIEIDAAYAEAARRHCDSTLVGNIESMPDDVFGGLFPADCWIFADVLEHLHDPWRVLARIRARMRPEDCVLACIPNMQHWSVQANLMAGTVFYQDSGLFDRTHIRWFTRITMIDLFATAGFVIERGMPRIFDNSSGTRFIEAIRAAAPALGVDPQAAVNDALAFQYVVKAVPAGPEALRAAPPT